MKKITVFLAVLAIGMQVSPAQTSHKGNHHARPTATLSASPSTVTAGQSVTLTWATTHATSATLNGATVATSGSMTEVPTATSTMTLTATGENGSTSAVATITVKSKTTTAAPTATLSASPSTVTAGQSVTLTWTTTNATSATLNGAAVATSGSMTEVPTASSQATLTATGAGGSTSAVAAITVNPKTTAAPTATLSASPSTVTAGQSVTLTWTTTNATSATLNGAAVATSGSMTEIPTASSQATLVATGAGGSTSAVAAITVNAASSGSSTAGAPHIHYTDLNVGAGTGGDNGNGVYVRIFGDHFGASQGSSTVQLGGNLVTNCSLCSWSDSVIVAQLGSAATTGNIQVTVNGLASNGAPFTVTPTTIVFVSPSGLDSNTGSFSAPFKTWRAAFNSVTSNDNSSPAQNTVIYLEPGVVVNTDDGRGYSAVMSTDLGGSSPTKQLSIVGYPGGTVSIGSTSVSNGIHGWGKYLTIANLSVIGQASAIDDEAGDARIINNTFSCPSPPTGIGDTACVLGETGTPADTWAFDGNVVNNTGGNVDKTYHAVYFSTGVNHADVGWNNVGQGFKGYCRSIMFHASSGGNLSDLHVHDNVITGGYCDGIGLASVDPSLGVVEAYNNVITHVAIASNPYGVANEAGIAINSDPPASTSGTVYLYNNTIVDAGGYTTGNQNGCFGIVTAGAGIQLNNNICSQPNATEPYIESGTTNVTGSNNLWFGAGAAPSFDSRPVASNPLFNSTTDFTPQSTSPALGAGTSTKASPTDINGVVRPVPPSIGAIE